MKNKFNTGFTPPLHAGAGFTFIELLIALTIFSIIAASIYYTLNAGIRVYSRGNSIIRDNQKLRIFFDTISLDLRNAVVYPHIGSEWTAEEISFPTVNNGLAKAVYYFYRGKVLRKQATLKEGFDETYAEEEVLIENLGDFSFEYCYKEPGTEDEYLWKNEWEFEDKIPRGVKIKLSLKDEAAGTLDTFEKTVFIPMGELGKEE